MFSEKETNGKLEQTLGKTTRGPPRVKKSPLPALGPGSLPLAGAVKSLSATDGVENRERCGARDAGDLRGLPRAGGAQGTQRLLGQRPAENSAHGQAQLSTAGYSPLPPAGTDQTFPTPSLCPRPGRGESPPKACRRPPTGATPTQGTPRLRLETAPRCTIPKCERPGGLGRHPSGHREQSPQLLPRSPRVTSWQQGLGDRYQPRTAPSRAARLLGRCRHKGDARVTHLVPRGSGSRSASLRAAAMAPPGARSRVQLPRQPPARAARPAAQRPLCLPALRPENCARGRRGASAH